MNIVITGGCGYVGTVLTETLLARGENITVIDTQWFGNHLQPNKQLSLVKMDIRQVDEIHLEGADAVIHLANIANDPAVELDPKLSWEVNVLASQQLAEKSIRAGVGHFIYASSGSVYGVKKEKEVTEDLVLVPISDYNKTKMVAERVLLSYQDEIRIHCLRPATVCGWSPRMRLDLTVNLLTFQALTRENITVFGGEQTRPNIHIGDMVRVYEHFLDNYDLSSGSYNAGFENLSILDIAHMVSEKVPAKILISDSIDRRSYRQNSDKLVATGFKRKFSVDDAIEEIIRKHHCDQLIETDRCYTVRWLKHLLKGKTL